MYANINRNYISNSPNIVDSFIYALKKLKEKISAKFSNITQKEEHSIEVSDINDAYIDDNSIEESYIEDTSVDESYINELIIDLKNSFNDIGEILFEIDFLEEEYYDFSSIRDMAFYILDNNLLKQIDLVRDLLNSFYDAALSKNKLSPEEYDDKYEKFSLELINVEQVFYTEICEPSKKYDEKTLSEITNAFLG